MTDIPIHDVLRVARAIADSLNAEGFTAYPSDFERQARAAIEALDGERVWAVYPGEELLPQIYRSEGFARDVADGVASVRPALLLPLGEEGEQ